MLEKPVKFILINLLSYFIILATFGFDAAFPLSIFFSIFIILYNKKQVGVKGALVLAIVYLLAFDNEKFYFSDYNIRIWYFYLILVYIISFFEFLKRKQEEISISKLFLFEYLLGFIFFIWSLYFLVIEDFISKINNIKYWVFYIGLILVLNHFFIKKINYYNQIINYFISITVFVMFWGILQFFTNLFFYPNFQIDYYNIRPSAFFSETTWYSEFTFFGMLLILLQILEKNMDLKLLYLIPFYIIGFLFSLTRNTYLALFLYLFFTFFLTIYFQKKINLKIIKSQFVSISCILLLLLGIVYAPQLYELSSLFALKFSGNDDSAQGRIEAYHISVSNILNSNILGNGYFWDKSHSTESGSALGSKSFNLFLMMGNIFGIFGGILFIILILFYLFKLVYYYYKYKSIYIKYSFIVFLSFIQMAMFAPIHQFPFGMLILSLSVFLFKKGIFHYEENNIRNTSI